ncbi:MULTISPECIES: hypothetical protein [unclassified Rhizobium]|uniref:hypothetical protein n=1 Tax=unclassified Rhizobium TaxID=2613769 RepID=UPI00146E2000|nr:MULTISPECIES: hypothetical protein [unclassified Rhizobium]MBD9445738.1 hypothetical protein [Rhizobium sp. RHZ01]NMN73837.1 hypothetical protein [Rhizobium sp. 57MFTsu3.2]
MIVETSIVRDEWSVDARLVELGLDRHLLLEVRDVARSAASNATDFHPANAAGTFAYQEGSWGLRDRFVGEEWEVDRSEGIEAIRNTKRGLRLVFSNVDIAAHDEKKPKPRSPKGAGAERACMGNLFGVDLPEFAKLEADGLATYYLMVDERGAAELTRPVVEGRTFSAYVERIYLSDGSDMELDKLALDDGERADDFDPFVIARS